MKILDRYLFKEMIFPFIYGFLIILILVWGNIVYSYLTLIVTRLSEWYLVLNFLLCKIPGCVLISLAAGGIFGVCIGLNRICKDSEMVALKSGGITSIRIFASLLIFGLFVSLTGYVFQEIIVVKAEEKGQNILDILYSVPGDLPIEPNLFIKTNDYSVYVGYINRENDKLIYHDVELYKLTDKFPSVVTAEYAIENHGLWLLNNGWTYSFNPDGSPNVVTNFKTLKVNIADNMFSSLTKPSDDYKSLSANELYKEIVKRKNLSMRADDLELEFNFKLAFPLSTFVILLCLVPLCLMVPMKSSAIGMVLGIVVFFIYWNIMWFARILGEAGGLSPVLAGWSIVIIFGFFGIILSFLLIKN